MRSKWVTLGLRPFKLNFAIFYHYNSILNFSIISLCSLVYSEWEWEPSKYTTSFMPEIVFRAQLYYIPHFSAIIAIRVYPSTVWNSLALVPLSGLEKNGSKRCLMCEKAFSTASFSMYILSSSLAGMFVFFMRTVNPNLFVFPSFCHIALWLKLQSLKDIKILLLFSKAVIEWFNPPCYQAKGEEHHVSHREPSSPWVIQSHPHTGRCDRSSLSFLWRPFSDN